MVEGNPHHLGNNGEITVYPTLESEISKILQLANQHGLKINVVSGGTKRGFGGEMESADILLSLANYKGIVEHTVGDMTLTVRAGTPFKELQDYLAKYKQRISLDPFWPEYATIGGIIAANDSGPKRLGYGSARDAVIGLRTVYPDGKVIRSGGKVVKNVAGYDMNKLFIGSMGTLGVISELTLKLRPLPKYESLILISFQETIMEEVKSFAVTLLDSMMEPVCLELLNPTLSKMLTGKENYTLAISLEDVESSVHYQEKYIQKVQPANSNFSLLKKQEAEDFWNRFYNIGPNGVNLVNQQQTEATLKIGVVNLDILTVLKESQLAADAFKLEIQGHGGLGHGLCQLHLKGTSEDVTAAIQHLREFVSTIGGYVVVKHLPFHLRQKVKAWGEKPAYFLLLEGIKRTIDPNQILNVNRYVGGI
ncbi:FAD-binding oxidoreductase [Bacillus sp. 31A1R]|uniref:FAD-binding oxidoreductase n=1 Tax=Robertmurraya mangrovi TaxID=3098077 RepID=A0ABU5IXY9_9BACI|nr:FAD-binding oxidoreductase [Bacillus sp. 31A1R]MDZ5472033.1 FAD-binding oxidoreductase [Bacillus sp. 31A1R]